MIDTTTEPPRSTPRARLLRPFRAVHEIGPEAFASAVHGLVVFVAVVGATFVADYPAWKIVVVSIGAVVLFWAAQVYAAILAHQHTPDASVPTGLAMIGHEARRAFPVLAVCVAPLLPLLLAVVGIVHLDAAYSVSVSVGVGLLALVGFVSLRNRRASWRRSLAAAAATGGFGAAIIAAETFLH